MYEFLDRRISLVLPRVRDFRGLNRKAFDGHGNYSLGLTEQLVFPELNPDKYTVTQGMNVTLVTSIDDNEESLQMLEQFGMPFKAEETEEPEVTKEPEAAEEDNTAEDGDEKAEADPANDE